MRKAQVHVAHLPLSAVFAVQLVLFLQAQLGGLEPARGIVVGSLAPAVRAPASVVRPLDAPPTRREPDAWSPDEPRLGLSLAERAQSAAVVPPNAAHRIREGVARILREQDDALGLNQPEVAGVARIVSDVAREAGAAHGSKAVFEVVLAANGAPLGVTRDAESMRSHAWASACEAIFERLLASPVRMGPAAARAGTVVAVAVEVLHVYPHGTDWQFKLTDCSDVPKIEHTDEHGRPLLATFGFGLRFDVGSWGADKQLVVRTRGAGGCPTSRTSPGLTIAEARLRMRHVSRKGG